MIQPRVESICKYDVASDKVTLLEIIKAAERLN